jgi:hypothetical protein
MKLFSVEEANALLPDVRAILVRLRRAYKRVLDFRDDAKRASEGAEVGGGGAPGGALYAASLLELSSLTGEMEALGVQIKDYSRGLIDFPHLRGERVVLLCWQLGEGDRIMWWHDVDAGFAGRQPL